MRLRRALLMAPVLVLLVAGEGTGWGARAVWRPVRMELRCRAGLGRWQAMLWRTACRELNSFRVPVRRAPP